MKTKKLIIGLSLTLISFFSSSAFSDNKTEDFVNDAKQRIVRCGQEYDKFRSTSFAANRAFEMGMQAEEASARLRGGSVDYDKIKHEEVVAYHKICAEKEKKEFIINAKSFIKSIKSADKQKSSKDMVSQWITAIDSIGNDNENTEISKFQTIANSLLLDL